MALKYLRVDVLNHKELLQLGYSDKKYYCGLKKFQEVATDTRDLLRKYGVKFPFNPACFKHDVLYGEIFYIKKWRLIKRLQAKLTVDVIFLKDMLKIIKSKNYNKATKKMLRKRAYAFFLIVLFGTVGYLVYLLWKKIKGVFK